MLEMMVTDPMEVEGVDSVRLLTIDIEVCWSRVARDSDSEEGDDVKVSVLIVEDKVVK